MRVVLGARLRMVLVDRIGSLNVPPLRTVREWTIQSLGAHERSWLIISLVVAGLLRGLLVACSPTPFGYVWDFYHDAVRILWDTGHLPASTDCWQCYHPPFSYIVGLPFYAVGRFIAGESATGDANGLRWLSALALISSAITIYYGYRLLRFFRCRGASLLAGIGLFVSFPALFVSSYGTEADSVLTAIVSAFIYYFARDFTGTGSGFAALRLGVLAGLAASTKYSGLAAIASVLIFFAIRFGLGPARLPAIRNAAIVLVVCFAIGGWKYVDNYRRYHTPFHANGSAQEGFALTRNREVGGHYEFTTFRLPEVLELFGSRRPRGALTDLPVYHSVLTTLHALAWTDMSFFSERDRHGDPSHPYPHKQIPRGLIAAVLVLGLVPELLAAVGLIVTIRRAVFLPLTILTAVGISAYVWWFVSQEAWALKTKYLLFLVLPFATYAVTGLAFVWNRLPRIGFAAGMLMAVLLLAANMYLFAFAIG